MECCQCRRKMKPPELLTRTRRGGAVTIPNRATDTAYRYIGTYLRSRRLGIGRTDGEDAACVGVIRVLGMAPSLWRADARSVADGEPDIGVRSTAFRRHRCGGEPLLIRRPATSIWMSSSDGPSMDWDQWQMSSLSSTRGPPAPMRLQWDHSCPSRLGQPNLAAWHCMRSMIDGSKATLPY